MSEIKVNSIKGVSASAAAISVDNSNGTCTLASGSKLNNCTTDGTTNFTIADGNLVVANGHGIDFSAHGQASGMTSELLDDYEEGSWSPLWSNATSGGTTSSNNNYGRYTKIGRVVHAHFYTWGLPTGPTGSVYLQGLPFSAGEIGDCFSFVGARYFTQGDTDQYNLGVRISAGNTYGLLEFCEAGNISSVAANFSGFINYYTNFTGTITYLTSS